MFSAERCMNVLSGLEFSSRFYARQSMQSFPSQWNFDELLNLRVGVIPFFDIRLFFFLEQLDGLQCKPRNQLVNYLLFSLHWTHLRILQLLLVSEINWKQKQSTCSRPLSPVPREVIFRLKMVFKRRFLFFFRSALAVALVVNESCAASNEL